MTAFACLRRSHKGRNTWEIGAEGRFRIVTRNLGVIMVSPGAPRGVSAPAFPEIGAEAASGVLTPQGVVVMPSQPPHCLRSPPL